MVTYIDADQAVHFLVDEALRHGSQDNCSAVLVCFAQDLMNKGDKVMKRGTT